jgi:polysaccharide export outer membrane protein
VVRPDGKISLPLIDEIKASGLTTKQLQDLITEKLKEFVAAPNVTVTVTQINSRKVSVVGQVGAPGVYPIGGPTTVLEILARAGGLGEYAKKKDIRIIRKEGTQSKSFKFNFKDVSSGKNLDQNIILKSGDIIIVP